MCDVSFKTILLPRLYLNLGCNNFFRTPMYVKLLCFRYLNLVYNNYVNYDVCEIFVNCDVTCDWLYWISMILICILVVWDPSWFRWTTGFIWAQVWRFDRFGDCYCTCALINWMVLWQLVSMQGSTLNLSYVYLK